MSTLESQLKNLKNSVHMSTDEHIAMRETLGEYMAMTPAPMTLQKDSRAIKVRSLLVQVLSYKFVPALLVLVMLATSGVGVAYASESALPGERLYKVKEFTEEIRAQVLIGNGARANWAERRAERRVQEAKQLAKLGKLSDERIVMIEARIEKHSQRAEKALTRLENKKPEKATRMRAALLEKKVRIKEIRKTRVLTPVNTPLEKRKEMRQIIKTKLKDTRIAIPIKKQILQQRTEKALEAKVKPAQREIKKDTPKRTIKNIINKKKVERLKRIQYANPQKAR